jgi:hypothetical protein
MSTGTIERTHLLRFFPCIFEVSTITEAQMAIISLPMHRPMLPAVIRQASFQLTHIGPRVDFPSRSNV